jgi:hypothetical protein
MVVEMITKQPKAASEYDIGAEEQSSEDFDSVVYQAWLDLTSKPPRFHALPDDPRTIEDPTERLLRLGRESVSGKAPSELFRFLLSETKNGAGLPRVTTRAKMTAQKRLDIANAFKDFLRGLPDRTNFKDAKSKFRIEIELRGINGLRPSGASVDDALAAYDIEWNAYSIDAARKGARGESK